MLDLAKSSLLHGTSKMHKAFASHAFPPDRTRLLTLVADMDSEHFKNPAKNWSAFFRLVNKQGSTI